YAIVGAGRTAQTPSGLARRRPATNGPVDEALRRDFTLGPDSGVVGRGDGGGGGGPGGDSGGGGERGGAGCPGGGGGGGGAAPALAARLRERLSLAGTRRPAPSRRRAASAYPSIPGRPSRRTRGSVNAAAPVSGRSACRVRPPRSPRRSGRDP